MTSIPSFITTLGPTAGVIIVVWYFLGYLKDQRAAAAKEASEERKRFADCMEKIATEHREAMQSIGGRVEGLTEVQRQLVTELRKVAQSKGAGS